MHLKLFKMLVNLSLHLLCLAWSNKHAMRSKPRDHLIMLHKWRDAVYVTKVNAAYATGRLRGGDGEVSLCDQHDILVPSHF